MESGRSDEKLMLWSAFKFKDHCLEISLSAEWALWTRCFQNSFLVLTLLKILFVYKFVKDRMYLFCIILHFLLSLPFYMKCWHTSYCIEYLITPAMFTPSWFSSHSITLGYGSLLSIHTGISLVQVSVIDKIYRVSKAMHIKWRSLYFSDVLEPQSIYRKKLDLL